ncbi:MAG: pilus assembly protein TadG-related protein [Actinomycetes bacterium]
MRRLNDDSGAIAVIVALSSVLLVSFGAIVIDVGALYAERRDLQNGTDAAAFAVAQACAGGSCGAFDSDAELFADGNASDDASDVTEVCGAGVPELPVCTDAPTGLSGNGYVRVTARTEELDGGNLVPPFLAQVLDPSYTGTEVTTDSTVVWGVPSSYGAELAITFSLCEYNNMLASYGTIGDPPQQRYATEPYDATLERTIYFHKDTSPCGAGPSGADLPGGFGWLDADGTCAATVEDGWASADPGASATQDCKAALEALLGKTLLIPIFDELNDATGTNGGYHLTSPAGFVLTGWRFPGTTQKSSYQPPSSSNPCKSPLTCISGFFVKVTGGSGVVGSGPNRGVTVTQMVP